MFLTIATEAVLALGLEAVNEDLDELDTELNDEQSANDHSYHEGLYIYKYMQWVQSTVRQFSEDGCDDDFCFDDHNEMKNSAFEEINDVLLRRRLFTFTNRFVDYWRDSVCRILSAEDEHENVRQSSLCQECDSGWEEEFGEYEGPDPDEVSEDEDPTMPHLSQEDIVAVIRRNRVRAARRRYYEDARHEAENDSTRRFICRENCDSFYEACDEAAVDNSSYDTGWLTRKWREFMGTGVPSHIMTLLDATGLHVFEEPEAAPSSDVPNLAFPDEAVVAQALNVAEVLWARAGRYSAERQRDFMREYINDWTPQNGVIDPAQITQHAIAVDVGVDVGVNTDFGVME